MTDQDIRQKLSGVKCFLLDMDGTIYLDTTLIDGTMDFLNELKKQTKRAIYITNKEIIFVEKLRPFLVQMGSVCLNGIYYLYSPYIVLLLQIHQFFKKGQAHQGRLAALKTKVCKTSCVSENLSDKDFKGVFCHKAI
mgnify:CR=1 FL=1